MKEEKILEIKKLFLEKRYSELIELIEGTTDKDFRTAQLLNVLGASKTLKKSPNKADLISATENFKEAYLKEKQTKQGLEALANFINVSLNINQYEESLIYFKEAENFCSYNEGLFKAISKVYKYLNDVDKTLFFLEKLIKNNNNEVDTWCSYIYFNSFKRNWLQKDFLKHTKLLAQKLPKYPDNNLISINQVKNKKIKLAFLSSDLKQKHSITYFLKTILNNINKEKYEFFLFSNDNINQEDKTTNDFKNLFDEWINIKNLDDVRAINMIREKKIDIIIDLMGITSSNRMALFKNRLAPLQISWLGYCNTTGINEIDYLIADTNLITEMEKDLYCEKIIFLKDIWNCHTGFDFRRLENPAPIKKNKHITFGSFNNFNKISIEVVEVWSKILKSINKSKLILKSSQKHDTKKLKEMFRTNGIHDSIIFSERKETFEDHLDQYNKIDIALDTFPYNGVTTSFEAIWMGVPVLTMKGFNFSSRCGESINKNIDIEYLIADNGFEYVSKAIELSRDEEKLINIRKKLFKEAPTSNLFNQKKFSKEFFKSLEKIYYNL